MAYCFQLIFTFFLQIYAAKASCEVVDYQYARECLILEEPFSCEVFEQCEKSLFYDVSMCPQFHCTPNKNQTFQPTMTTHKDSVTKPPVRTSEMTEMTENTVKLKPEMDFTPRLVNCLDKTCRLQVTYEPIQCVFLDFTTDCDLCGDLDACPRKILPDIPKSSQHVHLDGTIYLPPTTQYFFTTVNTLLPGPIDTCMNYQCTMRESPCKPYIVATPFLGASTGILLLILVLVIIAFSIKRKSASFDLEVQLPPTNNLGNATANAHRNLAEANHYSLYEDSEDEINDS